MPLKLIGFVLIFVILLAFITLNLDNKCDINFGFKVIKKDVPVYLTVFVAFLVGFCAEPLFFRRRPKNKSPEEIAPDKKPFKKSQKLRWKKDPSTPLEPESSFSDGGPYGID